MSTIFGSRHIDLAGETLFCMCEKCLKLKIRLVQSGRKQVGLQLLLQAADRQLGELAFAECYCQCY